MEIPLLQNLIATALLFYTTAYVCGLAVVYKGIRVNYTRKINHFVQFLMPPLVFALFPYDGSFNNFILESSVFLSAFILFWKPIRSQIRTLDIMFSSFDRPEDRPYTLTWVVIQFIAALLALIPLHYYAYLTELHAIALIPVLINGFGDGLAEPIGIRFGKHPYKTRALFTKKTYIRTLEGSMCVFITSVIVIIMFSGIFTSKQFIAALILMPIIMTLTEAKSPHTMDAPFLYLNGGLTLMLITTLID